MSQHSDIIKPASLPAEYWHLSQDAARLGPIIDLACGQGRNGLFLAVNDIPVILIDRSAGAVPVPHGPQRGGQNHPAEGDHGTAADSRRRNRL
jgi:hypothetical protein